MDNRCIDCKGEGKIALFRTFEDPCKTCLGSGISTSTISEKALKIRSMEIKMEEIKRMRDEVGDKELKNWCS